MRSTAPLPWTTWRSRFVLPAAAATALAVFVWGAPALAQYVDDSNPAVYWRLERQRMEAARRPPPVVIQRPTRLTRGVAPRPGFAREVPASEAEARREADKPDAENASANARPEATEARPEATDGTPEPAPRGPDFAIAVFGDNVGQMLAMGLNEAYADRPEITVRRRARENSGLVRDDYFDWPRAIEETLAKEPDFQLAVMMLGSNDRQAIREAGQTHDPLSPRWREIYAARVNAIVEAFRAKKVPLVWVGMPVMKNERLSNDLVSINEIVRETVTTAGGSFVDVWEAFVDDRNRFALHGPDVNGHIKRMRTGDGVHFTRAGARKLAHFVEGDVDRVIDQRRPAETPLIANAPANAPGAPTADPSALIEGDALARPDAPPARPTAGPVLPLNATAVSPGGQLATDASPVLPKDPTARRIAEQTLVEGRPAGARRGRADDFAWPGN
jgi:hypothetical protein